MPNKVKKNERSTKVKKEKKSETQAVTPEKNIKQDVKLSEKSLEKVTVAEKAPAVTKVGTLLKNMRLEKGLKVVDVAKKLCIRKQYLEAIEESNYSEIPPFPYGVGFVRSYAGYLGLNSGNIVELYKEETKIKNSAELVIAEPQAKSAMPGGIYILASLAALGALYGAWVWWNSNSAEDTPEIVIEEQVGNTPDVVVVEEVNVQEDSPAPISATISDENLPADNNAQTTISENNDKDALKIEVANDSAPATITEVKTEETPVSEVSIPQKGVYIEILEETWIEVKNSSKLYLSKELKPGDTYTLPNDKGLMLSVGKRGSVNVYVNGAKTDIARTGRQMHIDIDSYLNSNH